MLERPRAHSQRHAHCPLCGEEQVAGLVSEIGNAEDALCSDPPPRGTRLPSCGDASL
jgi:hypothetical protein